MANYRPAFFDHFLVFDDRLSICCEFTAKPLALGLEMEPEMPFCARISTLDEPGDQFDCLRLRFIGIGLDFDSRIDENSIFGPFSLGTTGIMRPRPSEKAALT